LLDDARLLFEKSRWDSAINRSYYAALNAAKAVLILFGIDPKTHEGVKTMVNKKLILEGLMPKEHGKWFRSLLLDREEVDYADYVTIDSSDAEIALKHASKFIEKIKEIIANLIQEMTPENPPE
jgi:hypothetical protein